MRLSEWPEWENSKTKNGFQAIRNSGCKPVPKETRSRHAKSNEANSNRLKIAFMANTDGPNKP